MPNRFAVLAASLGAVAALAAPTAATAATQTVTAPTTVDGLTLAAAPSQILAGQSMIIYGRLQGPNNAGQKIVLYHKIAGRPSFTVIQTGKTNSQGYYEFLRPDGIVNTNRSWFVVGPNGTHSNTISEQVAALVSLTTGTLSTVTGQQVVFSGHVFPSGRHANEQVKIQEQTGLTGTGWKTIAETYTNVHGFFSIGKTWRTPEDYTLRAVVASDAYNVQSFSDSLTESVQQSENPLFTVDSSSPITPEGQAVTLSGTLEGASGNAPVADTEVTLYGKLAGSGSSTPFQAIATSSTGSTGGYGFTVSPTYNTVYYVATTLEPKVRSATLFEGVQDQVTAAPSSTSSTVGGTITVSGAVTPNKTGSEITLQELGTDGYWHNLQYGTVATGSAYSFTVTFGETGTTELRVHISGDPSNIGYNTAPISISVSGTAPVTSLPTAS
jgi:phage protein U